MSEQPEFDPNRPYSKKREFGKAVKLCQDGHEFSQTHDYIGVDRTYTPPKIKEPAEPPAPNLEDEGRQGVLRRAAAKLEGYSVPDEISDAKKEDARARHAERLAG